MGVQDFTQQIAGLRASGRAEDNGSYRAFLQIKQILDQQAARLAQLESFQQSVIRQVASAGVHVKYFFVTADLSVPPPQEAPGSILFYLFLMDPTGGWTVTLPANFVGFYPDLISPIADRFSSLIAFKQRADLIVPAAFGPSGIITT